MKDSTRRSAGQAGPVESARWSPLPHSIGNLDDAELGAAVRVWLALWSELRIGKEPARLEDAVLGAEWPLIDKSPAHGRKGLKALAKLGLISIRASGSRRDVAVRWTMGAKPQKQARPAAPQQPKKRSYDPDGPDGGPQNAIAPGQFRLAIAKLIGTAS